MRIFRSLDEAHAALAGAPTIVGIGNFDGIHCGHRWVLDRIRDRARAIGATSVAITFDPHPLRLLRPADCPPLITPLPVRLRLLAESGVDAALVLPFTAELSRMSGEQFAGLVLRDALHAIEVHEGETFRFGHGAQSGADDLAQFGQRLGFVVAIHTPRSIRGMQISSSRVRECIQAGSLSAARALLGRPFSIFSTPAPGRGIGSRLTVPTINLAPYAELLPANGVYVTRMSVGEGSETRRFHSVTNVGNRPTFDGDSLTVETYLLDYDPAKEPLELTPETTLELVFLSHIRAERRFPSPEELKAQILLDAAHAQRYHHVAALLSPVRS